MIKMSHKGQKINIKVENQHKIYQKNMQFGLF